MVSCFYCRLTLVTTQKDFDLQCMLRVRHLLARTSINYTAL